MDQNENIIQYGLRNVHIVPITAYDPAETDESKAYTYGDVFKFPGAVSLNATSKTASTNFFADDGVYTSTYADNGYDINFEVAKTTNEFAKKILNEKNGKQNADDKPIPFAMMFEFDGDKAHTRHIFWHCDITKRPDVASETKSDSPTPKTETIQATAKPRVDTRDIKARAEQDWAVYENFFNAVPLPSAFIDPNDTDSPSNPTNSSDPTEPTTP